MSRGKASTCAHVYLEGPGYSCFQAVRMSARRRGCIRIYPLLGTQERPIASRLQIRAMRTEYVGGKAAADNWSLQGTLLRFRIELAAILALDRCGWDLADRLHISRLIASSEIYDAGLRRLIVELVANTSRFSTWTEGS